MRPKGLKTRIFLDGGDPEETRETIGLLGFLDGQTTNPTLIAKNPEARERLKEGRKFSPAELISLYREVVGRISGMIPHGSISVEVYSDPRTAAEDMLRQGREMFSWIPNAHIKFPSNRAGLEAAGRAVRDGLRVNLTLCFSEDQAAAVHSVTRGARRGDVFLSPFVGRLDDRGENGMSLIENILRLYAKGDKHVEVLTASVRNIDHLLFALKLGSDIVTVPFAVLKEWAGRGLPLPGTDYRYDPKGLRPIPYRDLDLEADWESFDLGHELTQKGMERFSQDWNGLIG
jgi:transaldolase